ncbi:MAG: DNA-3-methyladenine glycosylase I [Psychrobacter glaciei]|jgi:DNA-3-methyladenine glycosylase I
MNDFSVGEDNIARCSWCNITPEFIFYHDNEWGNPVKNDFTLFEKISLEGFQSGLSWRTILTKRDNFRKAFENFNFYKIVDYTSSDIEILVSNKDIVRHRGKILAVINNARCAIDLVNEFGSLAAYFWKFEPVENNKIKPQTQSTSVDSIALSKDLKMRGWKFVGPTTIYAFMQAMGLINDHAEGCFMRDTIASERHDFIRPTIKNKAIV